MFFHAFLKFDLPKARFLNFPQNSTPSLIGPFLIIGDCVYTTQKSIDILQENQFPSLKSAKTFSLYFGIRSKEYQTLVFWVEIESYHRMHLP